MDNAPTILDLFCGTGGFSLGAHDAGFTTKVAVDIDPILTSSFKSNFPNAKLVLEDVSKINSEWLSQHKVGNVDGITGGPPCQAFSSIGANDVSDPRRSLINHFFRVIQLAQPKFFVFENVQGLLSRHRSALDDALKELGPEWAIRGPVVLNAADYGAPTLRKRVFVFGFHRDCSSAPSIDVLTKPVRQQRVTIHQAIADLSSASELDDENNGFRQWTYGTDLTSAYSKKMRSKSGTFTGHMETKHTEKTLARFAQLAPGSIDKVGRYPRLKWDGLCPTLRAGTGSERGSYQAVRPVHPEQNRVITAREAARLQGFPDDFVFHQTTWHSCRMIGNSVSPIVAEALLENLGKSIGLLGKPAKKKERGAKN